MAPGDMNGMTEMTFKRILSLKGKNILDSPHFEWSINSRVCDFCGMLGIVNMPKLHKYAFILNNLRYRILQALQKRCSMHRGLCSLYYLFLLTAGVMQGRFLC